MLILAALVLVPTTTLSLTSPVAFAQGDQDQGPDASATATPAPADQGSVTPRPSASPTEASPSGSPSAPTATSPDEDVAPTPGGDESSTPAVGHSGAAPTIASDLADYPPGGTVTLNGAGWQAGEVVRIVVNDTGGLSWKLTKEVVADAEGRLTLTFNLPDYYVPDYDVTATGELSGVTTTTFTDAASGSWRYWMTASAPVTGANVSAGTAVTYNLNADATGAAVNSAVATLTLTDNVGGALVSKVTLSGTTSFGSVAPGVGTATWTLNDKLAAADQSAAVTAQIAADAPAGTLTATISAVWPGTRLTGTPLSVAHKIITVGDCSFATQGSGAFLKSICWFDLGGYNATAAASGQVMQQNLLNGYVLTYTITATSNTNVIAHDLPTYGAAYLGNHGFYEGILGEPALYQQTNGSLSTLSLTGISLKDAAGNTVKGFALVGADAESTHSGEYITWTSDKPIKSAATGIDLGNACGGGLTGVGTTSVTCTGDGSGDKTGAAILYSQDPGTFTQQMKGAGLQAVAFGVMVSGIQLNKQIVHQLPGDQFGISVKRDKTVAATAVTDLTTGIAATKPVYTNSTGASQRFTLTEESMGSSSLANYATTWVCTNNNAPITPDTVSAYEKTVDVTLNDYVVCTITNTAPALSLRKTVDNTAGGTLTPANWTLTATKSGSASAIAQAPSLSSTTTGNVTTASTAKVPVPASEYTLGESSAAAGAGRYAPSLWSCTNAGTGSFSLVGNKVTIAPGNDLTCTITNTYVPNVTLRNTWVDGVNGDKADLVINNAVTSPGKATSTSNGNVGSWTDATNLATATPAVGSTVSIAEVLQATNKGTYYTSPVVCVNGNNTVVPVAGGVFAMPNSNVTCDYSNRPVVNTVTWSKVDAGRTTTLLAGSEWSITGPSYPSPGIAVADCSSSPCAGPDTDPAVGQFRVTVRCGNCVLVETKSPAGFQLASPYPFSILPDGTTVPLGPMTNKRVPVPAIPLTGGSSTDSYLISGIALLLLAGLAAWYQRRRRIPHPRA